MIINHNIAALNTYRQLSANNVNGQRSLEKLSSGLRINRAGDDAAGLAISEKMRAQIRGLDQASRNSQDAISLIQTAEGALNETESILQRMRELATQAANDTNVDVDRGAIQDEINQLTSELNRIGNTTEFNTQRLLDGGLSTNSDTKITNATAATLTMSSFGKLTAGGAYSIEVDGRVFSYTLAASSTNSTSDLADALKEVTSGGVKLSEFLDIEESGGVITLTTYSKGSNSEIKLTTFSGGGILAGTATDTGDPTTIERAGLQATGVLSAGGGNTTLKTTDSITFDFTPNDNTDDLLNNVKLNFDTLLDVDTTYDVTTDKGRQDLVNDINKAISLNGDLKGKVTAALSKDNELQFISETGLKFSIDNFSSTLSASFSMSSGTAVSGNIQQVVGSGAQGIGFQATFQVGANRGQSMSLLINDMRASALGVAANAGEYGFTSTNTVTDGTSDTMREASLDVTTHESASKAIETINNAINKVSAERGKLGALQNRLEHTINNLGTASENLSGAESRIRDVDMAKEMMEYTKNNILAQAAQAMLAQANQQPQGVLQLLR